MSRHGWSAFFSVCLALVLLAAAVPAVAGEETPAAVAPKYGGGKEGWWWYRYVPKAEETKKEPPKKEDEKERRRPNLSDYTRDDLWNMYPDDLRRLLDDFRNKAVQNPSKENVREYYLVQDVARRKALAFAYVAAQVMQEHPDLDVGTAYPVAVPGKLAAVRTQGKEVGDTIRGAKEDFAILYFSRQGCEYCSEQDKILRFFIDKYKWDVRRLDMVENRDLAEILGVEAAPTLFLISRFSDRHITISQGVAAVSEIEDRLYRAIRYLRGKTTPEEFPLYDHEKGGPFDVNASPKW
jgi:conjugal transfer pilus assembly protein TraF